MLVGRVFSIWLVDHILGRYVACYGKVGCLLSLVMLMECFSYVPDDVGKVTPHRTRRAYIAYQV